MFKIKEKRYLVALIIVVIGVVLSSLLGPQVLRIIIDDYLMAKVSRGLLVIGFIYLGTFILTGVFDFFKGYLLNVVGQKIVRNIRSMMEKKLTLVKASYFTANSSGTITSKFINDVDNISSLFTEGVISMVIDCFKIVGIIVSIWLFNYKLGLFAIGLVPIILILTGFFRKRMLVSQKSNLVELGKVNNHIAESIKNVIMIKTFNRENYMENRYKSYLEENYKTMNKVNFYDSCYSPIIQVMTACSIGFIFYMAIGGNENMLSISIGQLSASIALITNLFSPIDNLGTELQSIQKGLSGVASVKEFLNLEEEEEKIHWAEIDNDKIQFSFNHVDFSYEPGKPVLRNINMEINPGENVVFVGRTGAGKSTLFKLIVGLLKPTRGEILINGKDVYTIKNQDKRKIFGYVEQNFSFVSGNVWDQISLGDKDISRENIERAVEFVGLSDYINSFEEGFHAMVSSEMFSQGQRQLMAIARAIVCNPPVLLLDEVTANLDTVTEEKVVEVLKRAGAGKTILSIAHRQSTINSAERIIQI